MTNTESEDLCSMCVYFPVNLPEIAYTRDDYAMLQKKDCSYDFKVGSEDCISTRKTSCSVVDMENLMMQKKKGS